MVAELATSFATAGSNCCGGRAPASARILLEKYGALQLVITQKPHFQRVRP
jgi:hypothetical protein